MSYDLAKHHRRSIRLADYDYSQSGVYFITVCTQDRECLFGDIFDGDMQLNALGEIVAEEWARSAEIRREIELDAFVIMPNHIHGIVIIRRGDRPVAPTRNVMVEGGDQSGGQAGAPTRMRAGLGKQSVGAFMAGFKSAVTKRINQLRETPGMAVWQRNYYEHIIRDEAEWNRLREYIEHNPARWAEDRENPNGKTV